MRNFAKLGIDLRGHSAGKVKTWCPWCQKKGERTHLKDKSLSVDIDSGLYYCHYCQAKGCVEEEGLDRKEKVKEKRVKRPSGGNFVRPEWKAEFLTMPEEAYEWLEGVRGISRQTLYRMKVTAQYEVDKEASKEAGVEKVVLWIHFNYFEDGQLVNVKSRTVDKRFRMVAGAELIPYNIDALLGRRVCYITEGEMDALAMRECGFEEVTSVPSGGNSNLTWMDRFAESHFEDKERCVLCMDDDTVGRHLTAELVRRLGAERCWLVRWSEGCKDANEELMQHGADSVRQCVEAAELIPVEGVFTAADLQEDLRTLFLNGMQRGAETGWLNMRGKLTFEPGRFVVVTGRPGDGKSEFVDELCLRLALHHDWRVAYFSPENVPIVYHLRKLSEKLTGFRFEHVGRMTDELYQGVTAWLAENVTHILPADDAYTLEAILERARQLVLRRGIRILVLDPLNRIEQRLEAGQTELQYISSLLNTLVRFAQQHRVLVILVAHPRKVNRANIDNSRRRVEMNDINGSSDFGNKADYCFVVDRDDPNELTTVFVDKCRFKHLGDRGEFHFHYDRQTGRFYPCDIAGDNDPTAPKGHSTRVRWWNIRWVDEQGRGILAEQEGLSFNTNDHEWGHECETRI